MWRTHFSTLGIASNYFVKFPSDPVSLVAAELLIQKECWTVTTSVAGHSKVVDDTAANKPLPWLLLQGCLMKIDLHVLMWSYARQRCKLWHGMQMAMVEGNNPLPCQKALSLMVRKGRKRDSSHLGSYCVKANFSLVPHKQCGLFLNSIAMVILHYCCCHLTSIWANGLRGYILYIYV